MLTRRRAWALTLVATLTMTISYIDRQTLAVLAPTVTKVFAISDAEYGWLLSAFSMAYLVGTPIAGRLLDRVGARRGLLGSLMVWTLVAAAHALVPGFWPLFALRILLGLAEAPSFPGSAQAIHRVLPPEDRSRGMGILFTGSSIGAMVAPKLATWLQGHWGWQGAFIGSALVGLVWVPLWLGLTSGAEARKALDNRGDFPAPSLSGLWAHRAIWRAMVVVFASAPAISFALLWGSKFLVKDHGVSQADVSSYLWLPPLLFDFGSIFFGDQASRRLRRVADPSSPARGLMAASIALGCVLALAPLGGSPWGAMLLAGVSMAGGGGMYALATADMMARVPPGAISAAGGITAAAQSVTHILVNPLLGRFLDHGGTYSQIQIALGLWVIPGGVLWILWPPPASR